MHLLRKYFLTVLLFFLANSGQAQHPVYRHYTVENGLPSSQTYHTIQDKKGYIWIATDRGICRYDGYTFKVFTTNDGLCDNTVFWLYEDYKGRIWCCTFSNRLCYYENGSFHSLPFEEKLQSTLETYVFRSIYVDSSDTIWLSGYGINMVKISPDGKIQEVIQSSSKLKKGNMAIKEISKGVYFYGQYDPDNEGQGQADHVITASAKNDVDTIRLPDILKKGGVNSVLNGLQVLPGKDRFVLTTSTHLLALSEGEVSQVFKLPAPGTNSLYKDKKGDLWIGMVNQGAICFANSDLTAAPPATFLDDKSVSSVFQDHEGGFWFTTLDDGVYYLSNKAIQSYTDQDILVKNKITDISASEKNGLLLCTEGNRLLRIYYKGDTKVVEEIETNTHFKSVYSDDKHGLWGSLNYRTIQYDPKTNTKLKVYYHGSGAGYFSHNIKNDEVWGVASARLNKFSNGEVSSQELYHSYKYNSHARCFYQRSENEILVGTVMGLFELKGDSLHYLGEQEPLLSYRINALAEDQKKRLVMATMGGGVVIKDGDSLIQISKTQGMVSDMCNDLFIDKEGVIWVGTNAGLAKIYETSKGFAVHNYTLNDGLVSNDISSVVMYRDEMWLGTTGGLAFFKKEDLKSNRTSPYIYVTKIAINEQDTVVKSNYRLSYTQNHLVINYTGISYRHSGKVEYQYKMFGLDSSWTSTNNTQVQYTTLPPGEYTFMVKAKNAHNVWSKVPATISFIIEAPFWYSWWFITLVIIGIGGLVSLGLRIRVQQLKRKGRLMQELNQVKHKALSAQMNPHFIFNSLNSIQNYLLKNNIRASSNYLSKFAGLMRLTLENSAETEVILKRDLEALTLYLELEQMRFKHKFTFELQVAPVIDVENMLIPPLLIQPFVENAIWHGIMHKEDSQGAIQIQLELLDERLVCRIEDNGVGRKKAKELASRKAKSRKSSGINVTANRLELINSIYKSNIDLEVIDLVDANGKASGTKVVFSIPVYRNTKKVKVKTVEIYENDSSGTY